MSYEHFTRPTRRTNAHAKTALQPPFFKVKNEILSNALVNAEHVTQQIFSIWQNVRAVSQLTREVQAGFEPKRSSTSLQKKHSRFFHYYFF